MLDNRPALALLAAMAILAGCNASGGDSDNDISLDDANWIGLSGLAQKGPFREGAEVRLWALRAGDKVSTEPTATTTVGEGGGYSFDDETVPAGPVLIEVEGEFFDEASGNDHPDPATLRAVLDAREDGVDTNINLLTDLVSDALMAEMANGADYDTAWESVRGDYHDLTGLYGRPQALDVLINSGNPALADDAPANRRHEVLHGSIELIFLSAAATKVDDWTQARAAFAADGADAEAVTTYLDSLGEAFADLLADHNYEEDDTYLHLAGRLDANFPLPSGAERPDDREARSYQSQLYGLGLTSKCSPGQTPGEEDRYRLCFNQEYVVRELEPDESRELIFEAPWNNAYRVDVDFESSGYYQTFFNYYGSPYSSTMQEQCEQNCGLGTRVMSAGSEALFKVFNDPNADTQNVTLKVTRLNEGQDTNPVRIRPHLQPHQGFAGAEDERISGGGNNSSHYWFHLPTVSGKRLVIDDFRCGAGDMRMVLSTKADRNNEIADKTYTSGGSGSCQITHDFDPAEGGNAYHLEVRNLIDTHDYPDPTGRREEYRIRVIDAD